MEDLWCESLMQNIAKVCFWDVLKPVQKVSPDTGWSKGNAVVNLSFLLCLQSLRAVCLLNSPSALLLFSEHHENLECFGSFNPVADYYTTATWYSLKCLTSFYAFCPTTMFALV